MSVAQFPGSMYPTDTRYAGPANAKRRRRNPRDSGIVTDEWTSERELPSGIGPFRRRQDEGKLHAASLRKVPNREGPLVLVGDAGADGEPEPRPAVLRGEERVEDALQILFGNRRPRVRDPHPHVRLPSLPLRPEGERQRSPPPGGHRLHPV